MSTHEDWQAAKERRDNSAINAARYLVAGFLEMAQRAARESATADDDMQRIRQELDGGQ